MRGNLVKMLVFAEEQHCDMVKDACIKFMASSDGMAKVVASKEYAQLRSAPPFGFARCAGTSFVEKVG